MRFTATLVQHGRTATGVQVPDAVVAATGSSRRPAVTATVNRHTWRSSVARTGGVFLLGVSAENRAAAGVSGGEVLDVELGLDTAAREVTGPDDLGAVLAALAAQPAARAAFDTLSYSDRRGIVTAVECAKAEPTRQRCVAASVTTLVGRTRR